jgi:PD-(D/E)XK nuclease superfamily protein
MALSGKEYADLVAAYILKNFGARGLTVYREVSMGKTIIGKNRHLDILVIHEASSAVLAIECKYQDTLGTVDEKIPYAIQDMQAMGLPVCLTYAGGGFSSGILHMLAACPIAAQCLPAGGLVPSRETRELDIAIAMAFKFWDLVVANKKPFALPPELPPAPPALPEAAADTLSVGPLFANSRSTDVDS